MSILRSLLHELQERLETEQPSPTAAQVAEAAESERLNVTLPGGVMARLKQQALQEGRSCSNGHILDRGWPAPAHHPAVSLFGRRTWSSSADDQGAGSKALSASSCAANPTSALLGSAHNQSHRHKRPARAIKRARVMGLV